MLYIVGKGGCLDCAYYNVLVIGVSSFHELAVPRFRDSSQFLLFTWWPYDCG